MSGFLHACLANPVLTLAALWALLCPLADLLPENRND